MDVDSWSDSLLVAASAAEAQAERLRAAADAARDPDRLGAALSLIAELRGNTTERRYAVETVAELLAAGPSELDPEELGELIEHLVVEDDELDGRR